MNRFQSILHELCNVTLSSKVATENKNCTLPFPIRGYSAEIHVTIAVRAIQLFYDNRMRSLIFNFHPILYPSSGKLSKLKNYALINILQGDYGSLVKQELIRRLQKAEKRKEQFLYQIDKHEKLARSTARDDVVERHQRKISQVFHDKHQQNLPTFLISVRPNRINF